MGAFHNLSVALTLVGAVFATLAGGARTPWRRGAPVEMALDDQPVRSGARFLVMATTLKRLPLGVKAFGTPREGMKVLEVDAPPRALPIALPALLAGREAAWLGRLGYRRGDAFSLRLADAPAFVLDGEVYDGGALSVTPAPALRFLVG